MITEIAFRVDYVSDYVPSMEEKEFGSPMKLNILSLPELSKFYSTDNYNNNLWIQHDQIKQSLTFEELMEDFEVADDNVVTQVIHLEYTRFSWQAKRAGPSGPKTSGVKAEWPRFGTRRGAQPANPTAARRDARIAAWPTRAAQLASGPAREGRKRRRREPL